MCLIFQVTLYTGDFRNNALELEQYISLRKLLQPIWGIVIFAYSYSHNFDIKDYTHC